MRGKRARAIRRQEELVKQAGEAYGSDPSEGNEDALDRAAEELERLRTKGEPIVLPRREDA